jgi:hypothetical protein
MKNNPGKTIPEKIYYYFEDMFSGWFHKDKEEDFDIWMKKNKEWEKAHPTMFKIREFYYEIVYRFPNRVSRIPKEIKWFIQRGKRGWSDCDVWNFYSFHSKMCKEALLHLKKHKMGYPAHLQESGYSDTDNEKRWNAILEKIICAFESAEQIGDMNLYMYYKDMPDMTEFSKKHEVKIQTKEEYEAMMDGFKLFFEHYWNLWD